MLPLTTPVAVTALAPGERWTLPVPESDGRPGTSAGCNTDSGSAVAPAPHDSTVVPATASATPNDGVALWQLHALHDAISDGKLPRLLQPGAGASDHAAGIRSGFLNWYPGLRLMGCYPHVFWHFTHSRLAVKRAHPSFGFIKEVLVELHTCHTVCNVLQSKYACVYLPFPSTFTSVCLTWLPHVYLSNTSIFTSCLPTCRSR